MGGGKIYKEAIKHTHCKSLYITHILKHWNCDTFFPKDLTQFTLHTKSDTYTENKIPFYFAQYIKKNSSL